MAQKDEPAKGWEVPAERVGDTKGERREERRKVRGRGREQCEDRRLPGQSRQPFWLGALVYRPAVQFLWTDQGHSNKVNKKH